MANIAKNIRLLRTAQNMTQDQLAEALHVTRQTVSNYETGKSQPDIDTIVRLAEALQADPNTLIYGIPTPPERKREYVKTAVAVAVMLLAVVLLLQEKPLESWIGNSINKYPLFAYWAFPELAAYCALGFSAMQVLSLCFGLRPYVQKRAKITLLLLTALWMALMLVASIHFLWMNRMYILAMETLPGFSSDLYWNIFTVPVIGNVIDQVVLHPDFPSQIFLIPGAALWLFRTKKA